MSTYFVCDPPETEGLRCFGHSLDKRSDCVQVVIASIVTPVDHGSLHPHDKEHSMRRRKLNLLEPRQPVKPASYHFSLNRI